MLTFSEKLAWIRDTLRVLASLSELPADEIDYQVYENLDADIRGALCGDNLRELALAEYVAPDLLSEIESLRDATIQLIDLRIDGTHILIHDGWRKVVSRAAAISNAVAS